MSPVLQARNLSCRLGGRTILSGIDLDLHAGEFHTVIGRNGAGKSTLLKLLTGELPLRDGSIHLWQKPLSALKLRELAKRRAVLSQHTTLHFDYQVIEVVLLGRLPHLGNRPETSGDVALAVESLRLTGLAGFEHRSYLTLSGGEQQRVQFARVLTQLPADQPALLFLDEPTSSLDLHHQHEILGIARGIADGGGTVFAVLHDLNLAARYSDRITLLHEGKIAASGPPDDVLTSGLLSRIFEHPLIVNPHPRHPVPLVISG